MKTILLAFAILLSFAACKSKKNDIPPQTLLNTRWLLESVGAEKISNADTDNLIFILLEEGSNQMNGFAGCNRFVGSFEQTEGKLGFTDIGMGQTACVNAETEKKFVDALAKVSTYRIDGLTLSLSSNDSLLLRFTAAVIE